ncbi:hypothetical protein VRK_13460 [Vibrio sp. MEBiC08052]|nr:hypothetical protein VRK_13460 [Vibrio sp. MEBiC08052]
MLLVPFASIKRNWGAVGDVDEIEESHCAPNTCITSFIFLAFGSQI